LISFYFVILGFPRQELARDASGESFGQDELGSQADAA
jgi:hypothetical protein